MRYLYIFLIPFFLVSCACVVPFAISQGQPQFYPIHELKNQGLSPGVYSTEGFVAKIYTCPPCPQGAACKVCMRDNIIISENNIRLDAYSLEDTELIIFTNTPGIFETGKKYSFTVRILDYSSTSEPINDIELVSFSPL